MEIERWSRCDWARASGTASATCSWPSRLTPGAGTP